MKSIIFLLSTLVSVGHTPFSLVPMNVKIVHIVDAYVELGPIERVQRDTLQLQVVDIQPMPRRNGIEVYARAWDAFGNQIGFGKDGTVDIERFRIINPPGLASNLEVNYREALLESLEHTISVKKEKSVSNNIILGSIGSTTTTVYPDAGSTTEDGRIQNFGFGTWDEVRNATTGTDANNDANPQASCGRAAIGEIADKTIDRFGLTFPSPDIGSDTISSVTVSLYGTSKTNTDDDGTDYLVAVSFAPASNTAFVTGDYDAFGDTDYSSQIDFGSLSTTGYNDFSFNATGIAAIDGSGINAVGFREGHDIENASMANSANNEFQCSTSENTGTTQDPKMVIEHAAATTDVTPRLRGIFF